MGLERAERAVGAGSRGCFSHLLASPSDDHLYPPVPATPCTHPCPLHYLPSTHSPSPLGHTKTEGGRGAEPVPFSPLLINTTEWSV